MDSWAIVTDEAIRLELAQRFHRRGQTIHFARGPADVAQAGQAALVLLFVESAGDLVGLCRDAQRTLHQAQPYLVAVLQSGAVAVTTQSLLTAGADDVVRWSSDDEAGFAARLAVAEAQSSRRRSASDRIRFAEAQREFLYDHAPIMAHSADSAGRLLSVSDAWLQTLGYTRAEVIGRYAVEFLTEASCRLAKEVVIPRFLATGSVRNVEYELLRKDGTVVPVLLSAIGEHDAAGRIPRSFTVLVETSERKRLESELASARDFLTAVINTVPDPIFVKDDAHRWVLLNDAFCAFMGRPADLLLGKSDFDFFPASEAEVFWEKDRLVLETGKSNQNEELFTDGKGQLHNISTKKAAFENKNGRRILVGLIHDLTERRRMEAMLLQADRLASVGTLAAGVAHEINNPLTYVMSNLSYLAQTLDASSGLNEKELPEVTQCLGEMIDGVERVATIIRGLRMFSRPDDDRRGSVAVRRVVETALRLMQNEIQHRAKLVLELVDVPMVLANEAQLAHVILNLLTNASQALLPDQADRNRIVVSTRSREGEVVIEVRDNGVGIAEDVLTRLFDPFFTTKPVGVGTGLGLSVCHGIITGHGGRIEVETKPGEGSTFRVVLPAMASGSTGVEVSGETRASRRTSALPRLLILDDEPAVGPAIERVLRNDAQVTFDTSGLVTLERLAAGETFDALLCDLMMPTLSGSAFYKKLCEVSPALAQRTGFITGGAFTADAKAFLDSVEAPILYKPFGADALRNFVRSLLTRGARP
jgi:two-component system NtrC family sensor kinase